MSEPILNIPSQNSKNIIAELDSRYESIIKDKNYQEEYLKELELSLTKSELDVSDEILERLRLCCQLWDVKINPEEIKSHRKFIGPIIIALKKLLFPILNAFFKNFIRQQKDFNAATIALIGKFIEEKR